MIVSQYVSKSQHLLEFTVWCAKQEDRIRQQLNESEETMKRRVIAWEARYGWWSKDHTNAA